MSLASLLVAGGVILHVGVAGLDAGSLPPLPDDLEATATILQAEDRREATRELLALTRDPDASCGRCAAAPRTVACPATAA
mgnify:CR=1 FL=1